MSAATRPQSSSLFFSLRAERRTFPNSDDGLRWDRSSNSPMSTPLIPSMEINRKAWSWGRSGIGEIGAGQLEFHSAQPFQPGKLVHVRLEGQTSVRVEVHVDRVGVVLLIAAGGQVDFVPSQADRHGMPDSQVHADAETSIGVEGPQIFRLDHRLHRRNPEHGGTVPARVEGLPGVVVACEVGAQASLVQRQLLRQRIGDVSGDFVGVLHEGADPHFRPGLVEGGDRLPERGEGFTGELLDLDFDNLQHLVPKSPNRRVAAVSDPLPSIRFL